MTHITNKPMEKENWSDIVFYMALNVGHDGTHERDYD